MTKRLEGIVSSYVSGGIPSELFESTKRRLIADQEQSRNSISALASDWATTISLDGEPSIAHEQELLSGLETSNQWRDRFGQIGVLRIFFSGGFGLGGMSGGVGCRSAMAG